MDVREVFAKRLTLLRQEAGMTKIELGEKISLHGNTIGQYEKAKREPSIETVVKLSSLFGCTTDYLLGKASNRNGVITTEVIDGNKIEIEGTKKYTIDEIELLLKLIKKE